MQLKGNVLITGGAGFLGRGILARHAAENWPVNFTVYSRDELKQDLCRRKYPFARYVLGDIRDTDRLNLAMQRCETVIHAGAIKYVDTSEYNVNECIDVNIQGSRSVIKAARIAGVDTCIAISTDKAVEPLNTYGLTKALMERLWLEAARQNMRPNPNSIGYYPSFLLTRYGNVIGSTGSVVPHFKRQAVEFGSVSVTDPNMTRYWLSINEAVDLVLQVWNAKGNTNGSIVVPNARAMKLLDVVSAVTPGIKVNIIGARPGEKCHEKLLTKAESSKSDKYASFYRYWPDRVGGVGETNIEAELVSSNPSSWITPGEFAKLAEEAALI